MAHETENVGDFKKEVDAGFDEALAEVAAALDEVPWSNMVPLPGLEPAAYADPYGDEVGAPEAPVPAADPAQERFDLWENSDDEGSDDAITAFAPSARVDWGPRIPTLNRHDDATEESEE